MLRSSVVSERILSFLDTKLRPSGRRKLRRRRPRVFVLDLVLSRAFDAGIVPPADDAPERDWSAFFEAFLVFLEGLIPLIERLIGFFPSDAD